MKKTITFHQLLLFILLIPLIHSCVKDTYNFDKLTKLELNPQYCAHIIHSNLTLKNFFTPTSTTLIQEDSTHLLTLVYRRTLFSESAENIAAIPDQDFVQGFVFNVPNPFILPSIAFDTVLDFSFNMNNQAEIDSAFMKAGSFNLKYSGFLNFDGLINIQCNSIIQNGKPLNVNLKFYGGNPSAGTNIDLTGSKFIFNNSGSSKNELAFNYNVTLYNNGTPVANPYNFNIEMSFSQLMFRSIFGYLGTQTFTVSSDTIDMNLYKNSYGGLIQFADPKLSFYINNSIGIPVGINLNAILFNTKNNNKLTLAGGIPKPWYIKYPVKLGTTAFDTLKLSKATGSNINVLVNNNAPTLLLTSADMTTNPASNPNVKNFLLDTSHVNVDEQVELPFYGTASGFILQDTINFNYENTIQGNNSQVDIEYVNFLIQTTNYFPVSANLQVYLTDSTKKILIDSLLDSKTNFIAAATPGPAPNFYLTIPVKNSVQKISVDNTRTAKWNNVKFLILRANLATINNGTTPVKIYSNNTLAVDIGIQTQVNANIKINK